MSATLKDPWEVGLMRQSGGRLAEVVALLRESIKPGVSTAEVDAVAEEAILERGGVPSFKGYAAGGPIPFPATICASVNEEVVHGIPSERVIIDGDIVSIDVGLIYGGYHSDCAFTLAVGSVDPIVQTMLDETERSLYVGIRQARPGHRIGDIGHAIQSHIEPLGFGVVREYVGHGIGRRLHEKPSVPNYGSPGRGSLLKEGMCLALEPMVTRGHYGTKMLRDGWTVVTQDGGLAAHFEHSIALTPQGAEILTILPEATLPEA